MAISEIKKRDGRIVKFEPEKIANAVDKAITAVRHQDGKLAEKLSKEVIEQLEKNFLHLDHQPFFSIVRQ